MTILLIAGIGIGFVALIAVVAAFVRDYRDHHTRI